MTSQDSVLAGGLSIKKQSHTTLSQYLKRVIISNCNKSSFISYEKCLVFVDYPIHLDQRTDLKFSLSNLKMGNAEVIGLGKEPCLWAVHKLHNSKRQEVPCIATLFS